MTKKLTTSSQKKAGANATVTICHTRTRDVATHTRRADILVVAKCLASGYPISAASRRSCRAGFATRASPDAERRLVSKARFPTIRCIFGSERSPITGRRSSPGPAESDLPATP